MSSYAPPIENVAIFDSANFKSGENNLTQSEADKRYLRFPIAQGTETFSAINVSGLATFNNTIKFPDNSIQSNAYTGAGALAGSYTNSNLTINSDGKITAIANGSGGSVGSNINANSLTTNTSPNVAAVTTTGIVNPYNSGGYIGLSGNVNYLYATSGLWSPDLFPNIQFIRNTAVSPVPILTQACLFNFTMFFYNATGTNIGQTSFDFLIFPAALATEWGFYGSGNELIYNVNNSIGGNNSFNVSSIYTPSGRQYWTFNRSLSGSGLSSNGYFGAQNIGAGKFAVIINPLLPEATTIWTWSLRCLNDNGAKEAGIGIKLAAAL